MTYKKAIEDLYSYFQKAAPDLFPELLPNEVVPQDYLGLMVKIIKMVFYPTGINRGSTMHQRLNTIAEHSGVKAEYILLRRLEGLSQNKALETLAERKGLSYSAVRNIVLSCGSLNYNDYFTNIVKCFTDIKVKTTMDKDDYNERSKGKNSWDSVSQVWRHRDLPGHRNRR